MDSALEQWTTRPYVRRSIEALLALLALMEVVDRIVTVRRRVRRDLATWWTQVERREKMAARCRDARLLAQLSGHSTRSH